jgi:hypothetical protein
MKGNSHETEKRSYFFLFLPGCCYRESNKKYDIKQSANRNNCTPFFPICMLLNFFLGLFANNISNKVLLAKIYKEFMLLNTE